MSSPAFPSRDSNRDIPGDVPSDVEASAATARPIPHEDPDEFDQPVRATPQRVEPAPMTEVEPPRAAPQRIDPAPVAERGEPVIDHGPETTVLPAGSMEPHRPADDDLPTRTYVTPVVEPQPDERIDEQTLLPGYGPAETSRPYEEVAAGLGVDRASVVERQELRYGGIRFGAAFFGWMAAAGVAIFLLALLTATGVAFGLANNTTAADINNQAAAQTGTAKTIGLIGAIALLVVLFVAYYCGGYVAARMARFNGARQGVAVWLWGLLFVVVIGVIAAVAGRNYNLLANLNLPRIPVDEGSVTTAGVIAIVAAILVSLGAAVLGGLAGMHYHRKVDRAGLGV